MFQLFEILTHGKAHSLSLVPHYAIKPGGSQKTNNNKTFKNNLKRYYLTQLK